MSRTVLHLLLAASFWLGGGQAAQAEIVVIDFDDVSAPGAFHQIFPGLDNGPTLEYPEITLSGCVILIDALFGQGATSGSNICATCDTCTLGDDNPGPPTELPGQVSGLFTDPVSSIDLDVLNGFGGSSGTFTLTAYDSQGSVSAVESVVAAPFDNPGFVQHLAVAAADIKSFRLTTNLPTGYTFAMDTLVFEIPDGASPAGRSTGLMLAKAGGGQIALSWDDSCVVTDDDYAIYEGLQPDFTSHSSLFCSTGGATAAVVTPAGTDAYYLVVPQGETREGSYGSASGDVERPAAVVPCLPRLTLPCD